MCSGHRVSPSSLAPGAMREWGGHGGDERLEAPPRHCRTRWQAGQPEAGGRQGGMTWACWSHVSRCGVLPQGEGRAPMWRGRLGAGRRTRLRPSGPSACGRASLLVCSAQTPAGPWGSPAPLRIPVGALVWATGFAPELGWAELPLPSRTCTRSIERSPAPPGTVPVSRDPTRGAPGLVPADNPGLG